MGTLAYMAPEVLSGEPADERSDLWALGVVLHEMVAGSRPFQGTSGFALTSAILREPASPLPEHTPAGLRGIVSKCLAKEPGQRYQSAVEVAAALEAVSPACSGASRGKTFYLPVARARRRGGGYSRRLVRPPAETNDPLAGPDSIDRGTAF